MPRWFVTGAGGQLATAFSRVLEGEVFLSHERALDIRDAEAVRTAVHAFAPDVVLHCAAYTDVDGAEADPETAEAVNVLGTRNVVQAVRGTHTAVVYFSTDYVFDGRKTAPYVETDRTRPLNVYGRTKLAGERDVLELGARHRLPDRVAVQRDRPQLREDDPRRGARTRRDGRAAAGRGRPGRLAHLRRPPRRGRRRGAAARHQPGPLPPRRQRLLLVVRAGRRGRGPRRPRRGGRADHHPSKRAGRRAGRPSRRSTPSAPSLASPTGRTAWPRPSTISSRSDRKTRRRHNVRLVVTGGAGFIGSNFVRYMLSRHDDVEIVNLDKLTYAGNLENLRDVEDDPRYSFVRGDICDAAVVGEALRGADAVVNFAAETHVDRSISGPAGLHPHRRPRHAHAPRGRARASRSPRYLQISTDEVYGEHRGRRVHRGVGPRPVQPVLGQQGGRRPARARLPPHLRHARRSSRAAPTTTAPGSTRRRSSRCSSPTRSTTSSCRSTATASTCATGSTWTTTAPASTWSCARGSPGRSTTSAAATRCRTSPSRTGSCELLGKSTELIRFVTDRPGHDRRYAIDCSKLRALGWRPEVPFEAGLARTVAWYRGQPRVVAADQVGRVARLLRAPVRRDRLTVRAGQRRLCTCVPRGVRA